MCAEPPAHTGPSNYKTVLTCRNIKCFWCILPTIQKCRYLVVIKLKTIIWFQPCHWFQPIVFWLRIKNKWKMLNYYEFFGFLCQVKNTWYVARKTAILFCVKIPKSNTLKNVRLTLFIVSESIYTKSATINLHYSIDGYQVAQQKKAVLKCDASVWKPVVGLEISTTKKT